MALQQRAVGCGCGCGHGMAMGWQRKQPSVACRCTTIRRTSTTVASPAWRTCLHLPLSSSTYLSRQAVQVPFTVVLAPGQPGGGSRQSWRPVSGFHCRTYSKSSPPFKHSTQLPSGVQPWVLLQGP